MTAPIPPPGSNPPPGFPAIGLQPPARPHAVSSLSADLSLVKGRWLLMGWSLQNRSAAATYIELYDGDSSSGNTIGALYAGASQDDRAWFGDRGLELQQGLFLHPAAGPWFGSFFLVPFPTGW